MSTELQDLVALQADLYAMLVKTNHAVNRCENPEQLYREACRIVIETGHFRFAWVGVPYLGEVKIVSQAGDDGGYVQEVLRSNLMVALDPDDPRGQGPTGRALSTGVRAVVNDFANAPQTAPWHASAARAGFHASASFPIREHGVVVAALTVYAGSPGFFTPALVDTLGEVTPALSLALDRFSLVITDARAHDNPIIYSSAGFEALTGYSFSEAFGRNCRMLQGPDTDIETARSLGEAIRAGRACTVELLNYRRDGQPFWNRISVAPITDESGVVTHFSGSQTLIEGPSA